MLYVGTECLLNAKGVDFTSANNFTAEFYWADKLNVDHILSFCGNAKVEMHAADGTPTFAITLHNANAVAPVLTGRLFDYSETDIVPLRVSFTYDGVTINKV